MPAKKKIRGPGLVGWREWVALPTLTGPEILDISSCHRGEVHFIPSDIYIKFRVIAPMELKISGAFVDGVHDDLFGEFNQLSVLLNFTSCFFKHFGSTFIITPHAAFFQYAHRRFVDLLAFLFGYWIEGSNEFASEAFHIKTSFS